MGRMMAPGEFKDTAQGNLCGNFMLIQEEETEREEHKVGDGGWRQRGQAIGDSKILGRRQVMPRWAEDPVRVRVGGQV